MIQVSKFLIRFLQYIVHGRSIFYASLFLIGTISAYVQQKESISNRPATSSLALAYPKPIPNGRAAPALEELLLLVERLDSESVENNWQDLLNYIVNSDDLYVQSLGASLVVNRLPREAIMEALRFLDDVDPSSAFLGNVMLALSVQKQDLVLDYIDISEAKPPTVL